MHPRYAVLARECGSNSNVWHVILTTYDHNEAVKLWTKLKVLNIDVKIEELHD